MGALTGDRPEGESRHDRRRARRRIDADRHCASGRPTCWGTSTVPRPRRRCLTNLPVAPERLQSAIAAALVRRREGADALLQAIAAGKASARLLQDRASRSAWKARACRAWPIASPRLLKGLPPADQKLEALFGRRRDGFQSAKADAGRRAHGLREALRDLPPARRQGSEGRPPARRHRQPRPRPADGRHPRPQPQRRPDLPRSPTSPSRTARSSRGCCCAKRARSWSWPTRRARRSAFPNRRSRTARSRRSRRCRPTWSIRSPRMISTA